MSVVRALVSGITQSLGLNGQTCISSSSHGQTAVRRLPRQRVSGDSRSHR